MKPGPVVALILALTAGLAFADPPPEPETYRGEPYNAPVPATLQGAHVIDTVEAVRLHDRGVPFLDVYPRTQKPEGLPAGTIWREPRHETVPGAIWLWDTGYDRLSPVEQARLETGLRTASGGNRAAPMVIFCRADCWMSWNAARRAVELGYTGIRWFPQGTDGWLAETNVALVTAEPVAP